MYRVATAMIVATMAGCASYTGIVSTGRDTYLIAKQQATGFPGLGNMKAEIIGEALRHCETLGKELNIVSTNETQPPYILGNYPRSEIQFRCEAKANPDVSRPKILKPPSRVTDI